MIYAVALLTQRIFTFDKSSSEARTITAFVAVGTVGYTILHCVLDNLVVHTIVFLAMLVFNGNKIRTLVRALPEEKERQYIVAFATSGECMIQSYVVSSLAKADPS